MGQARHGTTLLRVVPTSVCVGVYLCVSQDDETVPLIWTTGKEAPKAGSKTKLYYNRKATSLAKMGINNDQVGCAGRMHERWDCLRVSLLLLCCCTRPILHALEGEVGRSSGRESNVRTCVPSETRARVCARVKRCCFFCCLAALYSARHGMGGRRGPQQWPEKQQADIRTCVFVTNIELSLIRCLCGLVCTCASVPFAVDSVALGYQRMATTTGSGLQALPEST